MMNMMMIDDDDGVDDGVDNDEYDDNNSDDDNDGVGDEKNDKMTYSLVIRWKMTCLISPSSIY
jgi:hypothetical protein